MDSDYLSVIYAEYENSLWLPLKYELFNIIAVNIASASSGCLFIGFSGPGI
jgi:hypothetical protein